MSDVLVNILFWFFFIPFKLYFLYVNYKGRFRYGLRENSSFWRTLDKKVGVFSLVLDFSFSIVAIFLISALVVLIFTVPIEIALAFVLFGAIGWIFVNMGVDKISVERFEKNCLRCKHKEECAKFHQDNCSIEGLKQLSKSAIRYEKIHKQEEE